MAVAGKSHAMSSSNPQIHPPLPSLTFLHGSMFHSRNVYACMHPSRNCVYVCVCKHAVSSLRNAAGVSLCRSAEGGSGEGGGREGGQAVITNSIHFRNNNTALRVNRGLFSSGSHWSAQSKGLHSFTVISCYITGWRPGSASNRIAYLLLCTLHTWTHLPVLMCICTKYVSV